MDCRDIYESFSHYFVAPCTILFNVLGLFIVQTKAGNELSSYKIILLTTCWLDLLLTIYVFLLDPVGF